MAITRELESIKARIEVQTGVDKYGDPVYSNKSLHTVKKSVTDEQLAAIGAAIAAVLKPQTRAISKVETNLLDEI